MRVELGAVDLPDFGVPRDRPQIGQQEYVDRANELYESANLDWVAVYGDREHFANLCYLTEFDPRFEEAVLLLGPDETRVLIVGNEGVDYASLAKLPAELMLCQAFSLVGQDRSVAPRLTDALRASGIRLGAKVGVVGWKYLSGEELEADEPPAFVPGLLTDALRRVTGLNPADVSQLMLAPDGLRSVNTANQIAAFEWAAARASRSVQRIIAAAQPGRSELEIVGHMGYEGEPLSAHVMFASGRDRIVGLRSPTPRIVEKGDGVTTAIGYWGGLSCRAGLVDEPHDGEFLDELAKPYFGAIAAWYLALRIGAAGSDLHHAVANALADAPFGSFLNPGHQIGLEEWLNSPVEVSGRSLIRSGMMLQCDIIPSPVPLGLAINCEDTVAIADESLRRTLASQHPGLWGRIQARRAFMAERIGIDLAEGVMPLSDSPAYLAPFWLAPSVVCMRAEVPRPRYDGGAVE